MRQLWHKLIGLFFWAVLIVLWAQLIAGHKAGSANIAYSVQYLSIVAGAVLAVTVWWIRHNTGIYRRKGPRTGRPDAQPRTDEDRLGRPLRWEVDDVTAAAHLVVDRDGEAKVYREAA